MAQEGKKEASVKTYNAVFALSVKKLWFIQTALQYYLPDNLF